MEGDRNDFRQLPILKRGHPPLRAVFTLPQTSNGERSLELCSESSCPISSSSLTDKFTVWLGLRGLLVSSPDPEDSLSLLSILRQGRRLLPSTLGKLYLTVWARSQCPVCLDLASWRCVQLDGRAHCPTRSDSNNSCGIREFHTPDQSNYLLIV